MKGRLMIVNVFSDVPYAGNPAAAVLVDGPMSDDSMIRVARELRMPGTAFSWSTADAGRQVRFYTPTREVNLSGHTALACGRALVSGLDGEVRQILLETRTTTLGIESSEKESWLELPPPAITPRALESTMLDALGLSVRDVDPSAPPVMSDENDLLLWLDESVDLASLAPNQSRLEAVTREGSIRGVCVISTRTNDPEIDLGVRFFAPAFGIPEDVATGSVRGPLAAYASMRGKLPSARGVLRTEQGGCIGRRSVVEIRYRCEGSRVVEASVGGPTTILARGEIALPS